MILQGCRVSRNSLCPINLKLFVPDGTTVRMTTPFVGGGIPVRSQQSIFESFRFLIVIGVLAGALGGLAIGVITGRTPSTPAAAATSK